MGLGQWSHKWNHQDHVSQKRRDFPRAGPEFAKRKGVATGRASHRIHSWTAKNEMRSALGRMTQALYKEFSILPILEK